MKKTIHFKDAITLLESKNPVDLRLWKLSTGDILHYKGVRCISAYRRGGTHKVRFPNGEIREFRDITLFEINNKTIYR
ncbi:MAG: maintenance system killer protein [Alistipes sp.]|jgi:hypothetical protein|nr:maintenance system killer protein [Alistipes sp.]